MKILVIGEASLDISHYGTCTRICPEGPVPVFSPEDRVSTSGMAANVMRNIKNLRPDYSVDLATSTCTPVKNRFVDKPSGQLVLRVDENDRVDNPLVFNEELINKIKEQDAVVVSDYNKGYLNNITLKKIALLCQQNNILSFLDTKKQGGLWAENFTFIKINEKEFTECWSHLEQTNPHLIITLGANGCKYRDKIYPVPPVTIRDSTGAGDTFLASFTVKYLETKSIEKSIDFAQESCRVVVQKQGTAVVNDN